MGNENCMFANKIVIATEFTVLTEYLVQVGFADYGLTQNDILVLTKRLFHQWLAFRTSISTLRNSRKSENVCYFVDDSYVRVDEGSVYTYVKSCPDLLDYKLAAK